MSPRLPQSAGKVSWGGVIVSTQPRIRLMRSYDERSHNYLGYVLRLQGAIGGETREFVVAIGKGAQAKHQFRAGDEVSGEGVPVADSRTETAELYKVSKLKVLERGQGRPNDSPPWRGVPPELEEYRSRGHRRLGARTYGQKCTSCIWGCKMPVEIILDHWNPSRKKYRAETFCYGPLGCEFHRSGSTRKVPGRSGMVWEEEDWIDREAVAHRGPDDWCSATGIP